MNATKALHSISLLCAFVYLVVSFTLNFPRLYGDPTAKLPFALIKLSQKDNPYFIYALAELLCSIFLFVSIYYLALDIIVSRRQTANIQRHQRFARLYFWVSLCSLMALQWALLVNLILTIGWDGVHHGYYSFIQLAMYGGLALLLSLAASLSTGASTTNVKDNSTTPTDNNQRNPRSLDIPHPAAGIDMFEFYQTHQSKGGKRFAKQLDGRTGDTLHPTLCVSESSSDEDESTSCEDSAEGSQSISSDDPDHLRQRFDQLIDTITADILERID